MLSWKMGLALVLLPTFVCLAGCGGKKGFTGDPVEAGKKGELAEIHDVVVIFAKNHEKQAPKALSDLLPFEKVYPAAIRALKEKSIILVYGIGPDAGANAIMAYDKDAETNGGLALMANGSVKKVSADEVKAAAAKK